MGRKKKSETVTNGEHVMKALEKAVGIQPKKRGRPAGSKNKKSAPITDKDISSTLPVINVTQEDKQYIFDNAGVMSAEEIARNRKIEVSVVERLMTSSELDTRPIVAEKPEKGGLRRFVVGKGKTEGVVVMTPSQSTLDDKVYEQNLSTPETLKKMFGEGVGMIERQPVQ